MLVLSMLYFAVFRPPSTTNAAPIHCIHSDSYIRRATEGDITFNKRYRSTADIVWACWLTIFACTWVSVHPNVRAYRSTWSQRVLQRVELMFWAIVAPEVMVMWACRQWLGARAIRRMVWAKRGHKEVGWWEGLLNWWERRGKPNVEPKSSASSIPGWTLTHSHFLQMGGYMFEKDGVIRPIEATDEHTDLEKEAMQAILQRPETEEEINDRSKGDALAKAFVVLQTLWFVGQCAARGNQGLPITELELTTLAYASLNGIMYYFWWNKPLDAQCPIVVPLTKTYGEATTTAGSDATRSQAQRSNWRRIEDFCTSLMSHTSRNIYSYFSSWIYPIRIVILLLLMILSLPEKFIRRLGAIYEDYAIPSASNRSSPRIKSSHGSVIFPTFYSYVPLAVFAHDQTLGHSDVPVIVGAGLASVFGAIHCIAWQFPFHLAKNQLLWRVSALFICLSPLSIPLTIGCDILSKRFKGYGGIIIGFLEACFVLLTYASCLLYVPARAILLVISLIELAYLPDNAHVTVQWSDYLRHA